MAIYENILGCSESRADVAKLLADEITELSPLNVVWMASTDGGGVRVGRNGRLVVARSDCGRECDITIMPHNIKMTKFLAIGFYILYFFFFFVTKI